ncbi:uncharacterized protein LOC128555049 isoform X1 [Mercenaria mercenaria]|uniref:uncharacterized protein LOC128555049 isoform X1 n=1 Tax=Mercenaria mercenaria TaxID=6596 RepID=UPI00234F6E66|nr:uncharacterized protein LOC128555049 isoform X1 [Mercenaria mercenaria]
MCVNMENTINELYIESKLKILRVYLYTKKKTEKVGEEVHAATNKPSSTIEEVAPEVQIVTTVPIAVLDATLLSSSECMSSSDELDQHTVVSLPDTSLVWYTVRVTQIRDTPSVSTEMCRVMHIYENSPAAYNTEGTRRNLKVFKCLSGELLR